MMPPEDARPGRLLNVLWDAETKLAALRMGDAYGLYELLCEIAGRIAPTDSFYVCLYSAADQTLLFPFNLDDGRYDEPVTLPLGKGPTSWVIQHGEALLLNDDTAVIQHSGVTFGDTERRSRSAVHLPIRAFGSEVPRKILGVLSAQSYEADAYDPDAVRALQWLADRAGSLLQRERDDLAWLQRVRAAEAGAAAASRHGQAMATQFLNMLKQITLEAERLNGLVETSEPAVKTGLSRLCRLCYQCQTATNELPLRADFPTHPTTEDVAAPTAQSSLTDREEQVLQLLRSGMASTSIARRLQVSPDTVKFHLRNLYRKLGVTNRVQAVQATLPPSSPSGEPTPEGR